MNAIKVYVPRETAAASVGADEVAVAIAREAKRRGIALELVRNGSWGAGWLGGHEVVEVGYDPEVTSREELLRAVARAQCASAVYAASEVQRSRDAELFGERARLAPGPVRTARASDQKRHLRGSVFATLELTLLQETRVNSDLGQGRDPLLWLSPRQRRQVEARKG